jgi:hypothetical protein
MKYDFAAEVRALAKKTKPKPLAEALGALLAAKPEQPRFTPRVIPTTPVPTPTGGSWKTATRTRRGRRVPRFQRYTPTGKRNDARFGTFRHYMIATILAHGDVNAASFAHGKCDNPKFAKNKLDFAWAATNGYITLD